MERGSPISAGKARNNADRMPLIGSLRLLTWLAQFLGPSHTVQPPKEEGLKGIMGKVRLTECAEEIP